MPDFEKLLKKANASDKAELTVLFNARVTTLKQYQNDPTAANKRDFDAARDGLEECIKRLLPIYLPKKAVTTERIFEKQAAAHEYLQEIGYKVSRGKFSQDSHMFTGVGKQILLSDLMTYAKQHLDPPRESVDFDELSKEERKLDIKIKKEKLKAAEIAGRKEDTNWIHRDDSDLEICAWVGLMRDSAAHRITQMLPSLIVAVGGNIDNLSEGQAVIDQAITDACNDISHSDEVDVEIEEE